MSKRHRQLDAYQRRKIFERDDHKCQTCGSLVIVTRDIRTENDYKREALIKPIDLSLKGIDGYETVCRSCTGLNPEAYSPSELKFLPLERGEFTRVHNNILYALARLRLNSQESRVVLALIAKTYGFNQSEDHVPFSQLNKITGMSRTHCSHTVTRLIKRHIVMKLGKKLKLNKYYFYWSGNEVLLKQAGSVAQTGNEVLLKQATSKDTTKDSSKDNSKTEQKKDNFKTKLSGDDWQYLIDGFKDLNPIYKSFYQNKTERRALNYLADLVGLEKLKGLIDHLPKIVFSSKFAPKVTTPYELMKNMGKLVAYIKQNQHVYPKSETISRDNFKK